MHFGTQELNIEITVSVKEENPIEAVVKLDEVGTTLLHKYVENINKIQPGENFTTEQALKLLISHGFDRAFTIGHLQSKDIANQISELRSEK